MVNRPSHQQPNRRASSVLSYYSYLLLAIVFISYQSSAIASSICPPSLSGRTKQRPSPTSQVATTMSTFPRGGGRVGGGGALPPLSSSSSSKRTTTSVPSIVRLVARPFKSFARAVLDARSHLAAAAAARALSIFGMYPVDTIKTRMQMGMPFEFAGLYKGVAGSLVGQVPYGVLTFGSYEIYKRNLLERFPDVKPAFVYALAAIMGDVTGSGWLCPSEVVKQQLQAGMYKNTMEAISGIWRGSGIGGFYRGYTGGLAR